MTLREHARGEADGRTHVQVIDDRAEVLVLDAVAVQLRRELAGEAGHLHGQGLHGHSARSSGGVKVNEVVQQSCEGTGRQGQGCMSACGRMMKCYTKSDETDWNTRCSTVEEQQQQKRIPITTNG